MGNGKFSPTLSVSCPIDKGILYKDINMTGAWI